MEERGCGYSESANSSYLQPTFEDRFKKGHFDFAFRGSLARFGLDERRASCSTRLIFKFSIRSLCLKYTKLPTWYKMYVDDGTRVDTHGSCPFVNRYVEASTHIKANKALGFPLRPLATSVSVFVKSGMYSTLLIRYFTVA